MKRIRLGKTSIEISSVGFGCVQLTAHHSLKEAINTLECAYDAGITHFDVARSYGFGRCEGILSHFLKHKRDRVTVATKFGIEPPSGVAGNKRFISYAKKILKPFPGVLQRAKNHGASRVKCGNYDTKSMILSLEKSLRELQTDFIDIFLLHEAEVSDISNETLILALQQQVSMGKIRCFGVASDFAKITGQLNLIPSAYHFLQFNNHIFDNHIEKLSCDTNQSIITHSIFKPFDILLDAVIKNTEITKQFSIKINIDLSDPVVINELLFRCALQANPGGVVLFSSKKNDHVRKNVQIAKNFQYDDQQLLGFLEFVNIICHKMHDEKIV